MIFLLPLEIGILYTFERYTNVDLNITMRAKIGFYSV